MAVIVVCLGFDVQFGVKKSKQSIESLYVRALVLLPQLWGDKINRVNFGLRLSVNLNLSFLGHVPRKDISSHFRDPSFRTFLATSAFNSLHSSP